MSLQLATHCFGAMTTTLSAATEDNVVDSTMPDVWLVGHVSLSLKGAILASLHG